MESLAPAGLEVALDGVFLRDADGFVSAELRIIQQRLEDVMRALATPERLDHGLHHGDGAIVGARIRPRLEVVSGRDVPVREVAGFVVVRAQMCDNLGLAEQLVVETEVCRR